MARGRAADVDAAVAAARAAFDDGRWARRAPAQRKKVLLALCRAHARGEREELALLETLDMGKPIRYCLARRHARGGANCIAWYAEAVDKIYDEVAPTRAATRWP